MLTQTFGTQMQISVSAQNASGQAQSKPQQWGQERFRETQHLHRGRGICPNVISKNRETRRQIEVEITVHPFMAQLPKKSPITGGILQGISINSE